MATSVVYNDVCVACRMSVFGGSCCKVGCLAARNSLGRALHRLYDAPSRACGVLVLVLLHVLLPIIATAPLNL